MLFVFYHRFIVLWTILSLLASMGLTQLGGHFNLDTPKTIINKEDVEKFSTKVTAVFTTNKQMDL